MIKQILEKQGALFHNLEAVFFLEGVFTIIEVIKAYYYLVV